MLKKIITVALISVLSAVLVGMATIYSRSETLRNVRNIDAKIILHLVSATIAASKGEDFTRDLQAGIDTLGNRRSGIKLGVSLYRNDDLIVTNFAEKLPAPANVERSSTAVNDPASYEDIVLDDSWRLIIYRPEQIYSYGEYFSFLHTPIEQLLNEADRDVTWGTFVRKAGPPMTITLVITLVIGVILQLFLARKELELERKERLLQDSNKKVAEEHDKRKQLEKVRDELQADLQKIKQEQDKGEKLLGVAFEELLEEKEIKLKQTNEKIRESSIREARLLEENNRLIGEVDDFSKKLDVSQRRDSSAKKNQLEIIEKIWPKHEWHPKALEEARDWYLGANDKSKKERLTHLLGRCSYAATDWDKMANVGGSVLHNGGKDSVKLYWERRNNNQPYVMMICDGGNKHEAVDKVLIARLKTGHQS